MAQVLWVIADYFHDHRDSSRCIHMAGTARRAVRFPKQRFSNALGVSLVLVIPRQGRQRYLARAGETRPRPPRAICEVSIVSCK